MMRNTKIKSVTGELIAHRGNDFSWYWLSEEKPLSLRGGNKFLLACILDYQIPAEVAWENARRLAEDLLGDPKQLWHEIVSIPLPKWVSRKDKYSLHRFPKAHERVWTIGKRVVLQYDGDARKIWKGQSIESAMYRLNDLRVGEQISRMIIGALFDEHQIKGNADVKVDIHVRRVLGRVFEGEPFPIDRVSDVIDLTRKMYPRNPWKLDRPLYLLGKEMCFATSPECDECYLNDVCTYRKQSS